MEEVYFWDGGGGAPFCSTANVRSIFGSGEDLEQNDSVEIFVCGWDSEKPAVTVTFPTGETKKLDGSLHPATRDDSQYLWAIFVLDLGYPVGTYTFTFPSSGGIEQESVRVIAPSEPRFSSYTNFETRIVEELLLYTFAQMKKCVYWPIVRMS